MLVTPKSRITVVVLAVILYLTAPIVEWFYYSTELARGSYPADADSIALPHAQFIFGWLVCAPFAALLLWLALRSYPGRVSLFRFNYARPFWSIGWFLLFVFPAFYSLFFAAESIYRLQLLDAVQSLLTVYLLLCLRSSIVHSSLFSRRVSSVGEA